MQTVINIKCLDQTLTLESSPIIASGGLHENFVMFVFCEKWDRLEKVAVFYTKSGQSYFSPVVDGLCEIPHEVTDNAGTIEFGVLGVSNDVTKTSELVKYNIKQGAITDKTQPSDPTPEFWEQILAVVQEMSADAKEHADNSNNPHNVTKEQVGLGNVPNVRTDDQTPSFTQASERANIQSGEKLSTIFGKIAKVFNDLKTAAFKNVANDLSIEVDGYVLDARQGKVLRDRVHDIEHGGTGATSLSELLKVLCSGGSGNSEPEYVIGFNSNYEGSGYTSIKNLRKIMGLGDTTGALPIANGGTGMTSNPSMLTNLGSTGAASVLAASPRPGVTGTLGVANGGTGVTSNPSMLTNLGSTSAASVFAASPRPGITGTLGIANGGTGATTIADARKAINNLGMNPIASTAADTVANWVALNNGVAYFNKTVLNNQPAQRCFVVNKVQDSTVHQELYVRGAAPTCYVRSGDTGGGWHSAWKKVLDEDNGIQIVKLWENASPGSSLAQQTLSINLSGYSLIEVVCNYASGYPNRLLASAICPVKAGSQVAIYSDSNYRTVTVDSLTALSLNNTNGSANGNVIPVYIYGIKGVQ